MAYYQLCALGRIDSRFDSLRRRLQEACSDLGLDSDAVVLLDEVATANRDPRLPAVAIFFGYAAAGTEDHPVLQDLLRDSITIIPVVADLNNARAELPLVLEEINALESAGSDEGTERLSNLVLESFRLLRRERRLFISYKQLDSKSVANQLYEELDSRGFDVFIDSRSVPPAVDFQAELWHRLADSDVVVLIDTPNFRASRWTTQELANANATNIQILHLLWPGQAPDPDSAFSEFVELQNSDFIGGASLGGPSVMQPEALQAICDRAEHLRARAMAARYRYLVDNFCDLARDAGLVPSVQPERWVLAELPNGEKLAVVPAIGVPRSDRIHEAFDARHDLPFILSSIHFLMAASPPSSTSSQPFADSIG